MYYLYLINIDFNYIRPCEEKFTALLDNIKVILDDKTNNQFDLLFNDSDLSSVKIKYEEKIMNIYDEAKGKHVKY